MSNPFGGWGSPSPGGVPTPPAPTPAPTPVPPSTSGFVHPVLLEEDTRALLRVVGQVTLTQMASVGVPVTQLQRIATALTAALPGAAPPVPVPTPTPTPTLTVPPGALQLSGGKGSNALGGTDAYPNGEGRLAVAGSPSFAPSDVGRHIRSPENRYHGMTVFYAEIVAYISPTAVLVNVLMMLSNYQTFFEGGGWWVCTNYNDPPPGG